MSEPNLDDLFDFIWSSPSPYHAVEQVVARLGQAGSDEPKPATLHGDTAIINGSTAIINDSTAIINDSTAIINDSTAIVMLPAERVDPERLSFSVIGAHTDSPNLRIKPRPDTGTVGYRQLGIEPYGSVLLNSWLDRDLGISGRVVVSSTDMRGSETSTHRTYTRLLKIDRPLLRVPQLAIHLDRDANKSLHLNAQTHMTPVWGLGTVSENGFAEFLAEELNNICATASTEATDTETTDTEAINTETTGTETTGTEATGTEAINTESILAWDLMTHDLTPPSKLGRYGEFYAAARIDNLASCFAATKAIAALTPADLPDNAVAVVVLFDHEEVGSSSATGAAGPFLQQTLERAALGLGADRGQFLAALTRSVCVSVDGAHAVHPNYADHHDPNSQVRLNGGPAIKVNTNQRYATDANTSAVFQSACREAGVPFQQYSHRTDLPCGSTIGPITATQLGIAVVDVGSPQLSMHSAREMGGAEDPAMLTAALTQFFKQS